MKWMERQDFTGVQALVVRNWSLSFVGADYVSDAV